MAVTGIPTYPVEGVFSGTSIRRDAGSNIGASFMSVGSVPPGASGATAFMVFAINSWSRDSSTSPVVWLSSSSLSSPSVTGVVLHAVPVPVGHPGM